MLFLSLSNDIKANKFDMNWITAEIFLIIIAMLSLLNFELSLIEHATIGFDGIAHACDEITKHFVSFALLRKSHVFTWLAMIHSMLINIVDCLAA